jgi:hypothetical protein
MLHITFSALPCRQGCINLLCYFTISCGREDVFLLYINSFVVLKHCLFCVYDHVRSLDNVSEYVTPDIV